jgi:uncharacterized integral membrane protein
MKLSTLITFLSGLLTLAAFMMLLGGDLARLAATGIVAVVAGVLFILIRMAESCAVSHSSKS